MQHCWQRLLHSDCLAATLSCATFRLSKCPGPPPAADEEHNIIALRAGTRDETQRLPRILVHELLHCGLYEDRERRAQPHPPSLDPREEMAVQAMTDAVLNRLDGSRVGEAA